MSGERRGLFLFLLWSTESLKNQSFLGHKTPCPFWAGSPPYCDPEPALPCFGALGEFWSGSQPGALSRTWLWRRAPIGLA